MPATLRRLIGPTEYVGLYLGKVLFSLCCLSVPLAISRSALFDRLSSFVSFRIALFCLFSVACSTSPSSSWLYPEVARLAPT